MRCSGDRHIIPEIGGDGPAWTPRPSAGPGLPIHGQAILIIDSGREPGAAGSAGDAVALQGGEQFAAGGGQGPPRS
jgi:hypothetical protein